MKVVAIVLNNFKNDSRVLKENRTLMGLGHNVEVVAMHEVDLPTEEVIDGGVVHRIPLVTRRWGKWKPIQLIKYIEFICKAIRLTKGADVCHCHDLNALPIGVLTKWLNKKNVKIVYDAHEHETEKNGLTGWMKKAAYLLESKLIKHADKVITVSDSIAKDYVSLYNIETPEVILNCPVIQSIEKQDLFRSKFPIRNDQTIFLYQGAMASGRGLEELVEVFKARDHDNAVIVFMGYGPLVDWVQEHAEKESNIFYLPAVPPETVLNYTASADIGISFIQDICLSYRYCLPNKLFEYMMASLPVLVSDLPEMKKVVEGYQVGIVVEGNKMRDVEQAIERIMSLDIEQMKRNLPKVIKKYNWQVQEQKLINIYRALL
ncbi:MAG: glycosyltransferase family 4 protein [Gammaproteobacteria bacterium]|nr:glycosyltransferase family 4 protein [Gammaproteobacteria bacterium]